MSNYRSIEKVISAEIIRTNEDNLLANRICNTSFVGDIKNKGDSVTFIGLNEPTVYDYEGSITYEEINDSDTVLSVSEDKAFSFKVSDLEALRSSLGLKDSQAKRASYNLKKEVDTYVFGLHGDAETILDPTEATPANVLQLLGEIKEKLEEKNVQDGRTWIVVPPFIKTKLMLAGIKFQINDGINGSGTIGFTDELGCDIFVSNQLAKDEDTGAVYMMAGSYNAIAYAEQILDVQYIDRLENSFDSAVRGRIVFGAKVIKPEELVTAPVTDGGNTI